MRKVSVHEAKTHLSALLAQIEETGEEVIICRHRRPVASLMPYKKPSRLDPHPVMKDVGIEYDVTEPMDADEWPDDPDLP